MTTINSESSLHRTPLAVVSTKAMVDGKRQDMKAYTPLHQVQVHRNRVSYNTQSFKGVPQNLFSSETRYVGQLQNGSMTHIKSATLKITVQNTHTAARVPFAACRWFKRIDVKAQNGSKLLASIYPESAFFNYNLIDNDKLRKIKKVGKLSDDWTTVGSSDNLPASGTTSVYLPLVGSVFGLTNLYFQNSVGDINFEFLSNSVIASEGGATFAAAPINCLGIDLICETEVLSAQDELQHQLHYSKGLNSHRFLEPVENHNLSTALTNGVEKKFDLDSIVGDISHLVVCIRPAGLSTYVNLGDDSQFDIQDSAGKSLLGGGTPLTYGFLNSEVFSSHFQTDFNSFVNHFVLIPFANNVLQAYHGKKDGYLRLNGQRTYFVVKPSNNGTGTVWGSYSTYDVFMFGYIHRTLGQQNGRFSVADDYS